MYLEWYLKEKKAYEKTLEETVTELLSEKHLHVTTAESCTGGLISGTLVNAAGASAVLNEVIPFFIQMIILNRNPKIS